MKIVTEWDITGKRAVKMLFDPMNALKNPTSWQDMGLTALIKKPIYGKLNINTWEYLYCCSLGENIVVFPPRIEPPENPSYPYIWSTPTQKVSNVPTVLAPGSFMVRYQHFQPIITTRLTAIDMLSTRFGITFEIEDNDIVTQKGEKFGMIYSIQKEGFTYELLEIRLDLDEELMELVKGPEHGKTGLNNELQLNLKPQDLVDDFVERIESYDLPYIGGYGCCEELQEPKVISEIPQKMVS